MKSPTFAIPTPRWYDSTGEYLGVKCIISEAIPSMSMQAYLETGPDLDKARQDFIDIIVTVHRGRSTCCPTRFRSRRAGMRTWTG